MDVSEQMIDGMVIDMKRSNQNPFNTLQLYTCPLIRGLFYEHYNEVNRRSLAPISKAESKVAKSAAISGEGEGPAAFLIERGNILFNDECDYNSARVLFQQCYNYLCTAVGPTANLTLLTLYRLADSTRELGSYAEANLLYDQAVGLYLANAGDKVGLAHAYYGWGESIFALGDLTKAKQYFTESLNILRNQLQLGTHGIQTYLPEMGLIKLLITECKWSESIRQLERLINKVKADLGPSSLLLAQISLLLARSKRGKGLYSEVKLPLDQAFVILRQCVAEDHLYFSHALYELSEYHRLMGDMKLAKEKYDLTLGIYESYYTAEHDMVYKCRTNIALYEYDIGHINTSLNQHTEILKGRERIYGLYHPLIGESHLFIGDCLRTLGHYPLASEHYETAENLIKNIFTSDHPLFAAIRYAQAELARMHGFMERSRMLHSEAMKIRRELYGKEHPEYIQSMQGKADLDASCDSNMEEIITLLRRILKAKKKIYTEDHPTVAETLNTYGLVLKQQGKFHEALEKFQEALRLRLDLGDPNHYAIGEIRNNIALVHASLSAEGGGAGEDEEQQHEDERVESGPSGIRYTHDGKPIYDPKPPVEHYEGVTDITPVFNNTKYRKAIEEMHGAIDHILLSFPGTAQYQHPTVANIKGNIGLIERLEDEGKRDFILRLTAKQRALFREAEEKRLTEEFATMSADFSDAVAGSVRLLEAIEYLHTQGYDSYHPWLRKFESLVTKNLKEIPSDAEPQNAQQLKANRKLLEARDRMKRRLYLEAKKYYEETLQRLPEAEDRPEDLLSYAMTGECLNGLADIARIHCKLSEAKDFYHRSLSILKKVNGQETIQYADALLGYSDLLSLEGEYHQSDLNIDEVIVIKKRLLGERHESIVECLFKRCVVFLKYGRYAEGYDLCEYVLAARLQFPQTHQDFDLTIQIAETYNLMAQYFLVKGDYEKSEQSIQMTFKTCRKSVVLDTIQEEDHLVLAESYHLKGLCRLKQNKFKDALRNFGHSLSMKMRLLGEIRQGRIPQSAAGGDDQGTQQTSAMDPMEYCHVSIAVSLYGQAEALRRDGSYQIAADLYLKSIRLYSAIFHGEDNPAVANVMFGQAENYRLFGKFESSEKIYQTVLAMRQRIYGSGDGAEASGGGKGGEEGEDPVGVEEERHPDIADSYIGLGFLRYDQCRYQESLRYFERALSIQRAVYQKMDSTPPLAPSSTAHFNSSRPDTPLSGNPTAAAAEYSENIEIGKCYLHLGMVHLEMGNYDQAEAYFGTSLAIHKGYFPENHPVLCAVLFQQARLLQIRQRYHDANVLFTLVISIASMAYGEGHPEVGVYVIGQSFNQLFLGNYVEGKISAQRGLQIFNKVYGSDHPNTIRALLCIAKSLYQSGKYNKSLPYFQRTLDFMLRTFPTESGPHLLVSECYYELGNCLATLGRYAEARVQYQHALEIRKTILFHEHQQTLIVWSAYGEVEMLLGNLLEAEQIQSQIFQQLQLQHSQLPPTQGSASPVMSLFQGVVMSRLGNVIEKKGKVRQAKQLYERSLYIQQKLLGHEHPSIAETYCHLGRVLIALGKYEAAKGFYEKSSTIFSQFYRDSHPIISSSVYGIAQCLRCLGYPSQARGYYIKAINGFIRELGVEHPEYYLMMVGFAENRRDEGFVYPIQAESYQVPLLDFTQDPPLDPFATSPNIAASPHAALECDLSNPEDLFDQLRAGEDRSDGGNVTTCYAYPILVKAYLYFHQLFHYKTDLTSAPATSTSASSSAPPPSPTPATPSQHHILIDLKASLAHVLFLMGKFHESYQLQKELLSLTKYHYGKEFQYMAPVLFHLAEMERAMGKLSAKKKLYKGTGKPDLSVEAITGEKNRQMKTSKLRHQKMLLSSSSTGSSLVQPILPRIQSIGEKSRAPAKKRVLGYMGYQYPEIKTNEIDPSSPIDHLILNEIEVALREKEALGTPPPLSPSPFSLPSSTSEKGSRHSNGDSSTAVSMINEPKRLYDIAMQLHIERYPDFNDHPFTGDIYFGLAELHRSRKEYEEAYIFYKKAYANRLKILRNNHPLVASSLYGLAENYRQSGNLRDAKVYYDQSLLMRQETYGSTTTPGDDCYSGDCHIAIAESLYGLALWHYDKGSYHPSMRYCLQSYEIRNKALGPYHHLTLLNQQLLASLHYSLQNYPECSRLYNLLIPCYKLIYSIHHLQFITCLNNYSMLLKSQGLYSQSLKIFTKILSYQQHIYGPTHPEITVTYHNIGSLHYIQGDYRSSLRFYQLSYDMKLKCFQGNLNNLSIASSLYALAGVSFYLGNHYKAYELYNEAIDILTLLYDYDTPPAPTPASTSSSAAAPITAAAPCRHHPLLADALNNLGMLLLSTKQYNEAMIVLTKSLKMKQQIYGHDHLITSITLFNIAILYQIQGQLQSSKSYYLKCLGIRKRATAVASSSSVSKQEVKNCEENLRLLKYQQVLEIERETLKQKKKLQILR
jgi:tetratricopeptide (TPR) repeat protein